jgi:hypothetical protein
MFHWSKVDRQRRKIIADDQRFLEPRVRSFLSGYLAASDAEKELFYEAVAGASAGCQPENSISHLENIRVAEMTAEAANAVASRRLQAGNDSHGLERFITDAYATAAIAYRRAAGTYGNDEKMLKLGTAAVHLLTIATSRRMARSKEERES